MALFCPDLAVYIEDPENHTQCPTASLWTSLNRFGLIPDEIAPVSLLTSHAESSLVHLTVPFPPPFTSKASGVNFVDGFIRFSKFVVEWMHQRNTRGPPPRQCK